MQADYEFGRQSLAAATARNWFLLNEIDVQQDFLKSVVDILKKMNGIEQRKQKIGKVSMMEVHQVHAHLASAKEALIKSEQSREEAAR